MKGYCCIFFRWALQKVLVCSLYIEPRRWWNWSRKQGISTDGWELRKKDGENHFFKKIMIFHILYIFHTYRLHVIHPVEVTEVSGGKGKKYHYCFLVVVSSIFHLCFVNVFLSILKPLIVSSY